MPSLLSEAADLPPHRSGDTDMSEHDTVTASPEAATDTPARDPSPDPMPGQQPHRPPARTPRTPRSPGDPRVTRARATLVKMGRTLQEPLLLDAAAAAALLGVGPTTLWKLHSEGRIPAPVELAGTRWVAAELRAWARAGCPRRDRWQYGPREDG